MRLAVGSGFFSGSFVFVGSGFFATAGLRGRCFADTDLMIVVSCGAAASDEPAAALAHKMSA